MAVTVGTYSGKPGSPSSGDIHYLTDSYYNFIRWNGSIWVPNLHGKDLVLPPSFSWVNRTSGGITANVDNSRGAETISTAPPGSGEHWRLRVKNVPSAPYTIEAIVLPTAPAANFYASGLVWYDSGGDDFIAVTFIYLGGYVYPFAGKYVNGSPYTYSGEYGPRLSTSALVSNQLVWLRIVDTNTNREVYYSVDGANYVSVITPHSRTDFITADQVGHCLLNNGGAYDCHSTLIHWKES